MTKEISGTTTLYCLLGWPAKHSFSPRMHNHAFASCGIDSRYLAFEVPPEQLQAAVSGLRAIGAGGFNLTMPHKNAVIPMLDALSEAAELCGSVNTVVNENGRLIGHTTDGIGFVRALRTAGFEPSGTQITLLGGGGAAESLLTQLSLEGAAQITVFKRNNRTFSDTLRFAEHISEKTGCSIRVLPMEDSDEMRRTIGNSRLLINATSVGMEPHPEQTLIPKEFLFPELFVSDIIYHPLETRLLSDAASVGCDTLSGLPMLLYQGAEAFRLWTGQEMPVEKLSQELYADLQKKSEKAV